jgi:hypothetical protein
MDAILTSALVAGLLTALGFVLKGKLAKLAMFAGIWLIKKTASVWFWTTPYGRRLWRMIRYQAYRAAGPSGRVLFRGWRAALDLALQAHALVGPLRPW